MGPRALSRAERPFPCELPDARRRCVLVRNNNFRAWSFTVQEVALFGRGTGTRQRAPHRVNGAQRGQRGPREATGWQHGGQGKPNGDQERPPGGQRGAKEGPEVDF